MEAFGTVAELRGSFIMDGRGSSYIVDKDGRATQANWFLEEVGKEGVAVTFRDY